MQQYKVVSSRFRDLAEGAIVTDDDLRDLNVRALIDGGHIAIVASKPTKADDAVKEK